MNLVPGINSVALFHDDLFPDNGMGLPFSPLSNFATMPLAVGITYGALSDQLGGYH